MFFFRGPLTGQRSIPCVERQAFNSGCSVLAFRFFEAKKVDPRTIVACDQFVIAEEYTRKRAGIAGKRGERRFRVEIPHPQCLELRLRFMFGQTELSLGKSPRGLTSRLSSFFR
jgi:hypothetical protein